MSNYRLPFPVVYDHFGTHSPERKKMGLGPHRGCDYNGLDPKTKKRVYKFAKGTPLPAVGDGVIALNKWSAVLGWVVVLKVGKHYFGYCHLDKQSPLKVGTKVKSGDSVGGAGTSGSASSGVHLHFTLSLDLNGVFAGKVYDAHAFLEKMIAREEALAVKAATAPTPTAEKTKCCASCVCGEEHA